MGIEPMSTYVFGDLQGCYDELMLLLEQFNFDPAGDRLWFVGDLINRGPKNRQTLDFIMGLTDPIVVLGNHDLHFLAIANGTRRPGKNDTIEDVLQSSRTQQTIDWLRSRPLAHFDAHFDCLMVHAGVPPIWDLATALARAGEVEDVLRGPHCGRFFDAMYGDKPVVWDEELEGMDRLRIITNYFTRLRYCTPQGDLDLAHKANIQPEGYAPWFSFPVKTPKIIFGHWAAIEGITNTPSALALDTGCVWGRSLTALRLEDGTRFSTPALKVYQQ
jgi:bis(5'-nucleosyl)-tetraphosphatase (symmetrical)